MDVDNNNHVFIYEVLTVKDSIRLFANKMLLSYKMEDR